MNSTEGTPLGCSACGCRASSTDQDLKLRAAHMALRDMIRRVDHDSIDWAAIRANRLLRQAQHAISSGEADGTYNYCLAGD